MNNLTNIDFPMNECISKNTKLKFVDSVEFHRNTDIEVDNLIKMAVQMHIKVIE